jgi:hypothetical protein
MAIRKTLTNGLSIKSVPTAFSGILEMDSTVYVESWKYLSTMSLDSINHGF